MAPKEKAEKLPVAAKLEENLARIDAALARNMAVIKSLRTASAISQRPTKSKEQLDAEDTEFLQQQSSKLARVGLGLPNAADIKNGLSKRKEFTGNARLRQVLTGRKDLPSTKVPGSAPTTTSHKRVSKEDSEDEEEGRSSLGKSKKLKLRASHVINQSALIHGKQSATAHNMSVSSQDGAESAIPLEGRAAQKGDFPRPDSGLANNTSGSLASITTFPADASQSSTSGPTASKSEKQAVLISQASNDVSTPVSPNKSHNAALSISGPDTPDDQETIPAKSSPSHTTNEEISHAGTLQELQTLLEISPPIAVPTAHNDPVKLAKKREKSRLKKLKLREKQKRKATETGA